MNTKQFNFHYLRILSFGLLLLFIGCNKDDENNPDQVAASDLPLLATGPKLGTIIGFNPSHPPATEVAIENRWNEAINSGMSIGRLQIDWPELETAPGVYDMNELEERLADLSEEGLQIFLTLAANDSEEAVVPGDLEGLKFDNQQLIDRFNKLMDWVIPMLVKHNGWIIAIANEPDNNYSDIPGLADEMLVFLNEVKTHIHSIDSRMAVTITQAESNFDKNIPGMAAIVAASDIASWNFYGVNFEDLSKPLDADKIRSEIDELIAFTGGKQIIFQELGMHSGGEFLNSTEEIQNTFFKTVFTEIEANDQLRGAFVFQMVDWSPELTDLFVEIFREEGLPESFINQFAESLYTVGLINYSDGSEKLAWNTFTEYLEKFQ